MSLIHSILSYLQEFSNPNNEIRTKAEENINLLISQNPIDVINSLFDIIINDPTKNEAYFCAILIRNYLNLQNIILITQNSPDFFIHIKNTLLKFASNSNFPINLNMFLLSDLLAKFNAIDASQDKNLFPEYIPFLITLLDNPNFRSNSLEILCKTSIINDLQACYFKILEKCDIFSKDFNYRSKSFCFHLYCIKFDSFDFQDFFQNISNLMPQIFSEMPDKQFNECLLSLFEIYENEKYDRVSLFFPSFFILIIPRLLDSNRDEISKVNLVDHIITMLSSTLFFEFLSENENSIQFLDAICISASDPIQYPDLYFECGACFKNLYKNHFLNSQLVIKSNPQRENFFRLFKNIENSPNLFLSSLITKNFADLSYLKQAIFYATIQDDPNYSRVIIRHNGLSQIKKIILIFQTQINPSLKNELFEILIRLYEMYVDEQVMKVITNLSTYLPDEIINMKRPEIISLCNKRITKEIICCASYFCIGQQSEDSIILARFLFQATINLMDHDIYALSYVITHLSQIIEAAGFEAVFQFLNQVMPVILDDPKCFTNKRLQRFFQFDNDTIHEFAKSIFNKLIEFIREMNDNDLIIYENIENIVFAMKRVPFYANFIEFSNDQLTKILSIILKRANESDFRIKGAAIISISKLSDYYCSNPEILVEIFNLFNNLFQKEENIYIVKCLISLISRIVLSIINRLPSENIDRFILLYPSLFEHSYNVIDMIGKRDKNIDQISLFDISQVVKDLLSLFNVFLSKNLQLTTEIVLNFFFRNESNNQDDWRFNLNIFNSYFANLWSTFLMIVDYNIYSNDFPKIVQMMFDYAFNDENRDVRSRIKAIISLTAFFDQHEMSIELIHNFIYNGLIPLININKIDDDGDIKIMLYYAIASLIEISVKYSNKEINFQSIIQFIIENLNFLSIAQKNTFESLFNMINICLSNNETIDMAQALLAKAVDLVQSGHVEIIAIQNTFLEFQKMPEIHPALNQLYHAIIQIMQKLETEEE